MKKTVLITGASSGIGKSTALTFAQKGYTVIGTARSVSRLSDLAAQGVETVALDVSKEESIQQAFAQIYASHAHIDILINNAGFSQNGFFEELTPEHIRYQFEVNVFGLVRVTQMVLPRMRARRSGRIINIGSVGGDFTTAGVSAYSASKYAVESFSDGLRQEMQAFGIEVALVKPGGVKTEFVQNADKFFPTAIEGNPYNVQREKFQDMMQSISDPKKSNFPLLEPEEVVAAIVRAAESKTPKTRYRVGSTAKMMPVMKTVMSDRAFDNMILKQFKLK